MRVERMVEALAHRGPNASELAAGTRAVAGASRLAIRGLDSGRQPLCDEESGILAVCNGEIDNHRELRLWLENRGRKVDQQTDIAVIPGLYLELGEKFIEKLVGVFAIALWDPREDQLLLARDRAGERSIFYTAQEGVWQFATEVAALAGESDLHFRPRRDTIHEYLAMGCMSAPSAPYEEVRKVCPGEVVLLSAEGIRVRRYWRWGLGRVKKTAPTALKFDEIFREAVRRQTDVDVPFGVFLSGGLDSALIMAVARQVRPEIAFPAYTLRFAEETYDEGIVAQQVATGLGLTATPVWIDPLDLPGTLADLVRHVGEPLADPAWIPTALLARRAAESVKLVLSGEGGDELFGGYPTHLAARWGATYARLPCRIRALLARISRKLPVSDRKITLSYLVKRFFEGAHPDGVARHLLWKTNIPPEVMVRLGLSPRSPWEDMAGSGELLDVIQRIDFETTLAEGLLTKSDRAGMRSALEVRAPFLDLDVMEFAATLPVNQRIRGFTTKVFLKKYAAQYLPLSIIHRRKRGLSVPLSAWFRGPLYDWAHALLSDGRLARAGVRPEGALYLLEEHRRREADHARALWSLAVLSEWLGWEEDRTRSPSLVREATATVTLTGSPIS